MANPAETMQPLADKAAISLSALCVLHCLLLPVAIGILPSLSASGIADESFHRMMLIAVLPISSFALFLGCKAHRDYSVLLIGAVGLMLLCAPLALNHEVLGESGEWLCTLLGGLIIAGCHYRNFVLCRASVPCECSDS